MRLCPTPHCGAKITEGKYCARCQHARDRRRGLAADRGYDRLWADISRRWLRRYHWCGQRRDGNLYPEDSLCWTNGIFTRATVTDHIVPLKAGGARLDPNNFQSLCNACNVSKAVRHATR